MTTIELSTRDVSPFFIAQEHVEAFGQATKDYNKLHEKYVYGSQIAAWLKKSTDRLMMSCGYELQCTRMECRFDEKIENDSKINLPKTLTGEISDVLRIAIPVFSGEKKVAEATLTYGIPQPNDLGSEQKIKWISFYPLRDSELEDLAYAIGRPKDPLLLAFGKISSALQKYNEKRKLLPGMPVYLGQEVKFFSHRTLQAEEIVLVGVKKVRKTAGVGVADLVLARKKEGKTREGIAEARFFVGTAKQDAESGLESAVLTQTF
ncbi:Uncharacterised protein [uncultured archaeon]|nr:Uncharacterised protein [uncultured archaeon]